jgi:hypothetical protein
MPITRNELMVTAKTELRLSDETVWTDVQIQNAIDRVIDDISSREPLLDRIGLPIVQYTKDVDIGALRQPTTLQICSCDAGWDAQTNVTCSADTATKQEGTASAKQVIAALFTTGLIATEVITSVDLTSYNEVSFWIRPSSAVDAGVLEFLMDDTATCASPLESLTLPALPANMWTKVRLSIVKPSSLTAVISLGFRAASDPGLITIYWDDIRVSGIQHAGIVTIQNVEYPTDTWPLTMRSYRQFGDVVTMDLATIPTITSGTLTGDVTFTRASRAVTGAGTDFDGEVKVGYFLCPSTYSRYYKVAYVTDDTNIVLEQPFEEATITDTTDATIYRDNDSCVYLHCGRRYTLTDTYSNFTDKTDRALILGTVAYTAQAWSGEYVRSRAIAGVAKIASAVTELTSITDRMTAAVGYLEAGDGLINLANVGGTEAPSLYAQYAKAEIENANVYISKAGSHLSQVGSEVNIGELVDKFAEWANRKMAEYQRALRGLGRISDSVSRWHSD